MLYGVWFQIMCDNYCMWNVQLFLLLYGFFLTCMQPNAIALLQIEMGFIYCILWEDSDHLSICAVRSEPSFVCIRHQGGGIYWCKKGLSLVSLNQDLPSLANSVVPVLKAPDEAILSGPILFAIDFKNLQQNLHQVICVKLIHWAGQGLKQQNV